MSIVSAVLDLLYPPKCPFCRRLTGDGVCERCRRDLPFTRPGTEKRGDFFVRCVAPLYYEGLVRESLHRYKFDRISAYAAPYGLLLGERVRAELLPEDYDLVSWTPLSKKRLRERGFDQARLLAEETCRALGRGAVPTLEKIRDVERQSSMGSAEKRRANIAGAYRASDPALIRGKRILLVDDIVTTGSTLSECARTLRSAGASSVLCAALAMTRE